MAISHVTEIWDGRGGRASRDGVRTYTRMFQVKTDTFTDDAATARVAVDPNTSLAIPSIGDSFGTNDAEAIATDIEPRQDARDPRLWTVSVKYTSDPGGATSSQEENPLDRAAIESLGFNKTTAPLAYDIDGTEVRNSTGDMFDPLPEYEVARPVLRIERNEAAFDYTTAVDYMNSLNSNTFRGAPPGVARMVNISAQQRFENGVDFYAVTYEIEFMPQPPGGDPYTGGAVTWDIKVPDRGYRVLIGGVATLKRSNVVDGSSNDLGTEGPPEPVYLDGSGSELAPTAALHILTFKPYPRRDFDALGI